MIPPRYGFSAGFIPLFEWWQRRRSVRGVGRMATELLFRRRLPGGGGVRSREVKADDGPGGGSELRSLV